MPLPEVDFARIRPHRGSRNTGFEELCSQLAHLTAPAGSSFVRTGAGADAGVECYVILADGQELGWQSKYIFGWDTSLASQLDKSIKAALAKRPRMTEFTVCLPFDLPDPLPPEGLGARQKWDAWKLKWERKAAQQKRKLSIKLWDASALGRMLGTDDPAYSGRLVYWFDEPSLTSKWFTEQLEKAKAALGRRYTPETNIELPIRQKFLAFARDPFLDDVAQNWRRRFVDLSGSAVVALRRLAGDGIVLSEVDDLATAVSTFEAVFSGDPTAEDATFPLDEWVGVADTCLSAVRQAFTWVYDQPPGEPEHGTRPGDWARHRLFRLSDLLEDISGSLGGEMWRLANARAVLLKGPAGIGKSHLLADVVQHQVHLGRPAIFMLGSTLEHGEPWGHMMAELDLPSGMQVKHLLGALDAAAEASGVRALVVVDAINERNGPDIWPHRLAAFLKVAEQFPRLSVALSCRSTFVHHLVPDSLEDFLVQVEHRGFGETAGDAARAYLGVRGFVLPGAPNLAPEFDNPLFLKTCCDALEKEGKKEIPRGLRGVTAIFSFYRHAVVKAVSDRMKLEARYNIVPDAIERFTDLLATKGESYAPISDVIAAFETVHPSAGSRDRSLLSQLESEGMLTVEPVRQDDGSTLSMVRFTFERMSDHAIADRLLSEHLDPANIEGSFDDGTRLGELVFGEQSYRYAGIIEALAVQLPERFSREIVDLGRPADWTIVDAFSSSLLWRQQQHFTDRTWDLSKEHHRQIDLADLLISIATEPENKFNAEFLHRRLSALPMAERDAHWSIDLAKRGEESDPVETLIGWCLKNGMSAIAEDRAELAAITLTWFFSTSKRPVRDKATKSLASLLSVRLPLAAKLLKIFADVDDLYVRERLYCAVYGAVMQGKSSDGLADVAGVTYDRVFSNGAPPPNELLRDHARGIIGYAAQNNQLPSAVNTKLVHPPHKSAWPIEHVPDEVIESYKEDYGGQLFGDAIVSSTVNDGDFARYVIDHNVRDWAPVSIGAPSCPTVREIAEDWFKSFERAPTPTQSEAFAKLLGAAETLGGEHIHRDTPEHKAFADAEETFRASIGIEAFEEYRVSAQNFVRYSMFGERGYDSAGRFNSRWARRWICKRAHELGWQPELFRDFDRNTGYDRHDHRIERIGKKYQWLALHELVSRMADNLKFMGKSYGNESRPYQGAADIRLRDIDPSLLVTRTYYDGWKQWPRTWWTPVDPRLREIEPLERLAWLESENDVLNDASLIDLLDPSTNRRWLTLDTFGSWRQSGVDLGREGMQRETWYKITCLVTDGKNVTTLLDALNGKTLTSSMRLTEFEFDNAYYVGEYPWQSAFQSADKWIEPDGWHGLPVPVRSTATNYLCERGGYDYSIDETIRLELPAPWLANAMGLRLRDGQQLVYADMRNEIRFFDPSVTLPGYQAALVDRDEFLAMLDREGLAAVWVIAGEKGVFGGRDGFGGRLLHTGIYKALPEGIMQHSFHVENERPTAEHLEALLGMKPPKGVLSPL
jgi:hypothetical protein